MIQQMLAIWSLVPLPFLKPAGTFGSSQFTHCWSLAWGILSITLLACGGFPGGLQGKASACNEGDPALIQDPGSIHQDSIRQEGPLEKEMTTHSSTLAWKIPWTEEMSAIVRYFEHSLALPFFEIGMKTDLLQSYGHCWVFFQICWHIECSTLTALYFMILNSSTGFVHSDAS